MAIRTIHYRKPACSGRFEANKPNRGATGNETICEYQSRGHRGGTGITIAQMEKMDRLWSAFDVNIYCGTGEFGYEKRLSRFCYYLYLFDEIRAARHTSAPTSRMP